MNPALGVASIFLFASIAAVAQPQTTASSGVSERNPWLEHWIKRPWEIRYWMEFTGGEWSELQQRAMKRNAEPKNPRLPMYEYDPIIGTTYTFLPYGEREVHNVVPIEFSEEGTVVSTTTSESPLKGRFAAVGRLLQIFLSEGDSPIARQYYVAEWFHGFGDSSVDWAPTYCSIDEMSSPWSATDQFYKYGPKFKPADPVKPIFGCREWGYQLYDDARPYIDVTSYAPKTKTHPHGTYIRPFVGWARFGDHKPVIGKDADTWYCLYDCPTGDQPGPIPNIADWAKRSGWPVPTPPTRAPTFPDAPGKQGRYVTSAPAQAAGRR